MKCSIIFFILFIHCPIFCVFCIKTEFFKKELDTTNIEKAVDTFSFNNDRPNKKMTEDNLYTNIEKAVDTFSFNNDRPNKKMTEDNSYTKYFENEHEQSQNQVHNKYNENCLTQDVFYKHLIQMLLKNMISKDSDYLIEGKLYIRGTKSDFEKLKLFANGELTSSVKEIDALLSEMIAKPESPSYISMLYDTVDFVQSTFILAFEYKEIFAPIFFILLILIISKNITVTRRFLIFITLDLILVMSFFMTWWQLVKEAEIKLSTLQMKYLELPVKCRPSDMSVWDKIISLFSVHNDEECEEYYKARISSPVMQVTPLLVLTHLITTAVLHPISYIGSAISLFIKNSTAHLYWMQGSVQLLMYITLPIFILLMVLYIIGVCFKLSIGPIGFSVQKPEKNNLVQDSQRESVEKIREVFHNNTLTSITTTENDNLKLTLHSPSKIFECKKQQTITDMKITSTERNSDEIFSEKPNQVNDDLILSDEFEPIKESIEKLDLNINNKINQKEDIKDDED